jgi:transposase
MFAVPARVRVLVVTKPVDFRTSGAVPTALPPLRARSFNVIPSRGGFLFRSKRADRLKILAWDGSGLVSFWKRLEQGAFRWPPISDGVMWLSASPLTALVDGLGLVAPLATAYLQLIQRQQANAQINTGLGLLLGAFSHNPDVRRNMLGSMENLNSMGDPGSQLGDLVKLRQAEMQMNLRQTIERLLVLAKQLNMPIEQD